MNSSLEAQQRQFANLNAGRKVGVSKKRINTTKIAEVLRHLMHGATAKEIMEDTGINKQALKRLLDSLRYPYSDRICYISAWERHGKVWVASYKLGELQDRPKPKPLTPAQKSQLHRDRQKLAKLNHLMTGK